MKEKGGNNGGNASRQSNSDVEYQPNFTRHTYSPYAKVTRFIANISEIQPHSTQDPFDWIVDSTANAYITSFKNHLQNYTEFSETLEVKGFGGRPETAYGQGSITLTDATGKKITLGDVVYVPDAQDQIISPLLLLSQIDQDLASYLPLQGPGLPNLCP